MVPSTQENRVRPVPIAPRANSVRAASAGPRSAATISWNPARVATEMPTVPAVKVVFVQAVHAVRPKLVKAAPIATTTTFAPPIPAATHALVFTRTIRFPVTTTRPVPRGMYAPTPSVPARPSNVREAGYAIP